MTTHAFSAQPRAPGEPRTASRPRRLSSAGPGWTLCSGSSTPSSSGSLP
jgi:hypothetical protein